MVDAAGDLRNWNLFFQLQTANVARGSLISSSGPRVFVKAQSDNKHYTHYDSSDSSHCLATFGDYFPGSRTSTAACLSPLAGAATEYALTSDTRSPDPTPTLLGTFTKHS